MYGGQFVQYQGDAVGPAEAAEHIRVVPDRVTGEQGRAERRVVRGRRVVGLPDQPAGEGTAAGDALRLPERLAAVKGDLGGGPVLHIVHDRPLLVVEPDQIHGPQYGEGDGAQHVVAVPGDRAEAAPHTEHDVAVAHLYPHHFLAPADRPADPVPQPVRDLVHTAVQPYEAGTGLVDDVLDEPVQPPGAARLDLRMAGEQGVQIDPVPAAAVHIRPEVDSLDQPEDLAVQPVVDALAEPAGCDGVHPHGQPGAEEHRRIVVVVAAQAPPQFRHERLRGVLYALMPGRRFQIGGVVLEEGPELPDPVREAEFPDVVHGAAVGGRDAHGPEFDRGTRPAGQKAVGAHPAADIQAPLQYFDTVAAPFEFVRRHEAGYPGTDDGDLFLRSAGGGEGLLGGLRRNGRHAHQLPRSISSPLLGPADARHIPGPGGNAGG